MTQYTGKCVHLLNGKIFDVQVVDSSGIGNVLLPEEYEAKGVQPPLSQLPDCSSTDSA